MSFRLNSNSYSFCDLFRLVKYFFIQRRTLVQDIFLLLQCIFYILLTRTLALSVLQAKLKLYASKMVPDALNQHYYNLQLYRTKKLLPNSNCCLMVLHLGDFYKQRIGFHFSRKHAICRCSLTFLAFKQIQCKSSKTHSQ